MYKRICDVCGQQMSEIKPGKDPIVELPVTYDGRDFLLQCSIGERRLRGAVKDFALDICDKCRLDIVAEGFDGGTRTCSIVS